MKTLCPGTNDGGGNTGSCKMYSHTQTHHNTINKHTFLLDLFGEQEKKEEERNQTYCVNIIFAMGTSVCLGCSHARIHLPASNVAELNKYKKIQIQ